MPNWFSRLFERKESQFGPMTVRMLLGQGVWPSRNAEHLAREGYQRNVISYRCIRMVAEGAASIPWTLYTGEKEIEKHPLLDLLRRPNPMMDGTEFLEAWYSFIQISGNGFLEAVRGPLLPGPTELYVLRPERVKVVPGPTGWPGAYDYTVNGQTKRVLVDFDRNDVPILHTRTFHPLDDWYGMSPLDPAAWSIDAHSATSAYNKALLENMAIPSGALIVQPDGQGVANLTEEQATRLKNEFESRFQGKRNAGRPMVLEGGLDWKAFSASPKDMLLTDMKRDAAREIAMNFGVPPMLLGIPGDNTFANYQEANKTLWRQTIIPMALRSARALTTWLSPMFGDNLELKPNIDELDALADERVAQWERIGATNFLTVNEKRVAVGYEPIEGGDVVLVPAAQIPLADAGASLSGSNASGDGNGNNPDDTKPNPNAKDKGKPGAAKE